MTPPTVRERLERFLKIADEAHAGPWRNEPLSTTMGYPADESETRSIVCADGFSVAGTTIFKTLGDANFIATSRTEAVAFCRALEAVMDLCDTIAQESAECCDRDPSQEHTCYGVGYSDRIRAAIERSLGKELS